MGQPRPLARPATKTGRWSRCPHGTQGAAIWKVLGLGAAYDTTNNQGERREAAAAGARFVSELDGCLPFAPPCWFGSILTSPVRNGFSSDGKGGWPLTVRIQISTSSEAIPEYEGPRSVTIVPSGERTGRA